MTKRIISSIVLIVFSIVMANSVFASYVGTSGKNFNLVFNRYVEGSVVISFTDLKGNSLTNDTFSPSLVKELRDQQCRISVLTNSYSQLKVTFNLFKNKDTSISSTIPYTIQLYDVDEATPLTNYTALRVANDNTTGGTFYTGNLYGETLTYKYNLAFKFEEEDLNKAVPGNYSALIVVEVISTE